MNARLFKVAPVSQRFGLFLYPNRQGGARPKAAAALQETKARELFFDAGPKNRPPPGYHSL